MAINSADYNEIEKQKRGYLEIGAYDYYFNKMRPYLKEMCLKCKTDGELIRTIEKVINASDSFCQQKDYNMVAESFEVLNVAITDKNYFNGVMKKAPEEEREMVRNLIEKISDLNMIIKCESPVEHKEEPVRERLGYLSPIGENSDYTTHNMTELTKSSSRKRIPNV